MCRQSRVAQQRLGCRHARPRLLGGFRHQLWVPAVAAAVHAALHVVAVHATRGAAHKRKVAAAAAAGERGVEGGGRGQTQIKVSNWKVRHKEFGEAFLDPQNTNPGLLITIYCKAS